MQDRSRNDAPLKTAPCPGARGAAADACVQHRLRKHFRDRRAPAEIALLYVWLSKWLLLSLRAPSLSAWLSSLAHSTGDGARQRCTFAAQDEHLALVAPLLQTSRAHPFLAFVAVSLGVNECRDPGPSRSALELRRVSVTGGGACDEPAA